jgi:hypothetical protein
MAQGHLAACGSTSVDNQSRAFYIQSDLALAHKLRWFWREQPLRIPNGSLLNLPKSFPA